MKQRINYGTVASGAMRAMLGLERYVREDTALEAELLELVKMRASQINGCAYCLDMHSKDARAIGVDEQKLHVLAAWREAPFYSARERAALAWTEALTLVSTQGVSDALFEETSAHFSEKDLVDLTMAVNAINSWNRLSISFRPEVGSYKAPSPNTLSPNVSSPNAPKP